MALRVYDREITLSSTGIQNQGTIAIQDGFTFIVGSERFRCPRTVSGLLSERTCNAHSGDQSITEIVHHPPPSIRARISQFSFTSVVNDWMARKKPLKPEMTLICGQI
jgi:hypothetical protein